MKDKKGWRVKKILSALLIAGALVITGCSGSSNAAVVAGETGVVEKEIVVFAAASLTESFSAIEEAYEAEHPGIDIVYNFAGSQMLTSQIEAGGTPDCFFSANTKYPKKLVVEVGTVGKTELAMEDIKVFASNELIMIGNSDEDLLHQGMTFEDVFQALGNSGLKIVIANESVPVGKYTQNMLKAYETTGSKKEVEAFYDHVISYENDVKSVVTKVQMKEADIGVVYYTDLVNVDLMTVNIPADVNQIATYGALNFSDDEEVVAFFEYVLEGAGQDILGEFNFGH